MRPFILLCLLLLCLLAMWMCTVKEMLRLGVAFRAPR